MACAGKATAINPAHSATLLRHSNKIQPCRNGLRVPATARRRILSVSLMETDKLHDIHIDTRTGQLLAERFVVLTPNPATPEACADAVNQCAQHFQWKGAVGIGVPAVVKDGTTWTAAN
ncbi:unnamed protein product, partial [Closterium sp. NIES-54]